MFTVLSPSSPWLSSVTASSLVAAIRLKLAWAINQDAIAVILDQDGYIVSQFDQDLAIVEVLEASF